MHFIGSERRIRSDFTLHSTTKEVFLSIKKNAPHCFHEADL